MKIHAIDTSGKVTEYDHLPVSKEIELEDYIEKNPEIIEKGLMILKRQVNTDSHDYVDLLGLDYDGNVVIIETKKESNNSRKVITQVLEYGIWAEKLNYTELNSFAKENKKLGTFPNLEQMFQNRHEDFTDNDFGNATKLYIVHEKISDRVKKIASWLSSRTINIHCVELNFHEKDGHKIVVKHDVVGSTKSIKKQVNEDYSEELHTRNVSTESKEMYYSLKDKVQNFGSDVECYAVKYCICFKTVQKFLEVRIKQNKIVLSIRQLYDDKECFSTKNTNIVRSKQKNYKEIHIHNLEELESCLEFIRQSYTANKK